MDSTRWNRIQELFHKAADHSPADRLALLKSECGNDEGLIADVMALLAEEARGTSLLDRDVAHVAHEIFADEVLPSPSASKFGPYRIRQKLGEGGMGVVYLAEREDLGSLVAVKFLRDAWLSPARRERFSSEQRTLAQLNHPSIARLYDADALADGTPWFVMEYVEGVPLTDYCNKRGCRIEERLRLFLSVCEAVQYAHRHAVIHRDLKPANILVKSDATIRLLDFGIAKQLESLDVPATQTRTELRLMTPAYAAPEQVRGGHVGMHTDVYSLGVILYELLVGHVPFDLSNRTPAEAEKIIVEQEPEKPSVATLGRDPQPGASVGLLSASKSSWADLDVLCQTAMHKDVNRRYRSVEALMRDVEHYLNGQPLDARPDTLGYHAGKFVRRNRRAVTITGVVFSGVVALVIFFTVRLAVARNAALAEAARTQRIQRFMTNLFQGGDEAAGPSDDLRVITLLDRGVQEAQSLEAEPAVQAELYQTLGTIYQKLGKFDKAESLLQFSLEKRKSVFGSDHPQVAEGLVAFGLLRSDQAQLEEAKKFVHEGLEMSKRHLPPNHPAVARATSALGKVFEDRGEYPKAIQTLEEAVRLQTTPGVPSSDLSVSMSELANSHFYAGHYAESDSLNRRVLEMDRENYGPRHPHIADDLINLGANQYEWGHYSEAERFYRQALEIIQAWYGEDHQETASALTMLGRALVSQKRFDEAAAMMNEALRIQESVYGKVHPRVASALNELGKIAQQQQKLEEAEADFSRMAAIYREVYNGKHYYIGIALANLGGVYMEKKEFARATKLFREALQLYSETLPAGHPTEGIGRIRLGRALLRQGRYAEAESETLAGYKILMKQASPPIGYLQNARKDLAEEYEALKQPENATKFRAEYEKEGAGSPPAGGR